MTDKTNHHWMLEEIQNVQSLDALKCLGEVIKMDGDDGEEYALSPQVESLREAYRKRKKELE